MGERAMSIQNAGEVWNEFNNYLNDLFPDELDDEELLSECCGAEASWSIEDGIGNCSECGEWTSFLTEKELHEDK